MAKKDEGFFKKFDSMFFTDTNMLNAVALAVASSLEKTFQVTNREELVFRQMLKHSEDLRRNFQLLKFVWNLMKNRIDEIKKGGEREIRARRLLAIEEIPPDFFTDALWNAQLWINAFKNFCLKKDVTGKAVRERFEIFDREWDDLNDKFLATFKL